ncbi:hypothetical protein PABG_11209 [Paracoccidioides brasiliensis Pb03]|nr:hypothetical protein PABG_11209 [Paracoccidioides brasiliensis Pb03]
MPNEEAIQLAIKDLRAQKVKNYVAIARKHSINKETLRQCYNSLQLVQDEVASQHKKKLSNQQEQMLLLHIEKLLNEKIEKYNIESSNIYDFDEKSFLIDISQTTKWIIPVEALKTK